MARKKRGSLVENFLGGFGNKNTAKDGVAGNLRYDVPTTGQRGGNVLTDEEAETQDALQSRKMAGCCMIVSDDGRILAVSRKDNPNMWGFPGGKVDPGETYAEAAVRELKEETGLDASDPVEVFRMTDKEGYTTATFACKVSGEIDTDESGCIAWVTPKTLTDPETSPFTDYNQAIFKKLGMTV